MSRALVASSSQLLALPTFARRIPPPTPTFYEAGTADTSLWLPDLAIPTNVRILQRQPPIRDLDLPMFPAGPSDPNQDRKPKGKAKVKGPI